MMSPMEKPTTEGAPSNKKNKRVEVRTIYKLPFFIMLPFCLQVFHSWASRADRWDS